MELLGPLASTWWYTFAMLAVELLCVALVAGISISAGKSPAYARWTAAAYALSPFAVLSALAGSTAGLSNAAVLCAVFLMQHGSALGAGAALGAASYLSVYPMALMVPVAAAFAGRAERVKVALAFAGTLTALLAESFRFSGHSWAFLWQVYGKLYASHRNAQGWGL